MVSWMMNTVSEEIVSRMVYAMNAFSIWINLIEIFDKVNHMPIHQLHKEITTIS